MMQNQIYTPDRTWKNVWIVLRSTNNRRTVLSCKACPQGVSPKWKYYNSVTSFLCYLLGVFLPLFLYYFVVPKGWSKANKIIVLLFLTIFWVPISTILVFISFRFIKWMPADNQPTVNQTKRQSGDGSPIDDMPKDPNSPVIPIEAEGQK